MGKPLFSTGLAYLQSEVASAEADHLNKIRRSLRQNRRNPEFKEGAQVKCGNKRGTVISVKDDAVTVEIHSSKETKVIQDLADREQIQIDGPGLEGEQYEIMKQAVRVKEKDQ